MKILFLTENFAPEGNAAASRVYERACYWTDWGHDVTVITTVPNFPQGRPHDGYRNRWYQTECLDGIKVVRVKSFIRPNRGTFLRILDFLSFMVTGYLGALVQPRPDVVVATSPQFFSAVAGWLVGLTRRLPFVFELGDIWPASIVAVGAMGESRLMSTLERFELFLYRGSACVVALTPAFKSNLISRGIDGGKIAVVMNGVDLSRFKPRQRDVDLAREWRIDRTFVAGYFGTLGLAHGLTNVIDAAEILRNDPRIRFLFVGDGADRPVLERLASERGLGNVIFVPAQPKESMPRVWSVCDTALVHLKSSEVFREVIPSKMFEAMAMGCPIILAAPEGEASRILEEEGAGRYIPAGDAGALASAVLGLAEDADLRRSYSRAGLAAAERHTRERQAKEMLQALEIAAAGWGDRAGIGSATAASLSRLGPLAPRSE